MQRTVSLVLEKNKDLSALIVLYNHVANVHIQYCLQHRTLSKKDLHHALYKEIRIIYPEFPSALIQCARDHAVEMLKGNKMNPHTKKCLDSSIRFDQRTMKVFLQSGELQLTTHIGRKKYKVKVPTYFLKYFFWEVKSLNLGVNKKHCLVKVVLDGKVPEQSRYNEVLGIYFGLKKFTSPND